MLPVIPTLLCAQETTSSPVNWTGLEKAWSIYKARPNEVNAERVCKVLPPEIPNAVPTSAIGSRVEELVYSSLGKVERQIKLRKRGSVRLAFRLMTIADGAFAETLVIILGDLIRLDPVLFLEEFKANRDLVVRLDALLGNCGPEFVDNEKAEQSEIRARISALESVNQSDLIDVREECIAELKSQLD